MSTTANPARARATAGRPPGSRAARPEGRAAAAPWTFLTNHAHVLTCIAANPAVRMRDVASQVGVTERAVQRIVSELEDAGYLSHVRVGRRNRYKVHTELPLRHSIEQHCLVSSLLKPILGGRRRI
ncbi:MAG: winged helix-turn-helix domain-containing protein [Deltaproteobacteria bacterium]|nr:winged helix-turn-helix domain-containing protein [Deltaproteobacteria bacterium]